VLTEMRYLLLQGTQPAPAQVDAVGNPTLLAALADDGTITPARWSAWWALAEKTPARPWAKNLEERLLLWTAKNAKPGLLPPGFPSALSNPTALWGKLRAIALARSGDLAAAEEEIASVPEDPEQAPIAAQVRLARGRVEGALRTPGLPADAQSYLVRVLLNPPALALIPSPRPPASRSPCDSPRRAGGPRPSEPSGPTIRRALPCSAGRAGRSGEGVVAPESSPQTRTTTSRPDASRPFRQRPRAQRRRWPAMHPGGVAARNGSRAS
jgi:hypothetical protein